MPSFLFLEDRERVLGVWEVGDPDRGLRAQLELGLRYPGCRAVFGEAEDFKTLKARFPERSFGALDPDPY